MSGHKNICELPFPNVTADYLHGSITRQFAERLLLSSLPEKEDGRFLIRVYPTDGCQYRVRILESGQLIFLDITVNSRPAFSYSKCHSILPPLSRVQENFLAMRTVS
eukprot:gene5392-8872_t